MKIKSAEFITSAVNLSQIPISELPEIAFIGRSNVGKSSLINSLCGQKRLAKISSQPGKTRVINFYRINNQIHFVDLPGYGYAKLPSRIRSGWKNLIENYLKKRTNLKLGLLIIDSRHEPTQLDLAMMDWMEFYSIPFVVVLTKSDKLPIYKVKRRINHIRIVTESLTGCRDIVSYSSVKFQGQDSLFSHITSAVESD